MFSKKKKETKKPTVFTTSSTTCTENTITTANGYITTTRIVQSSYEERRSNGAAISNFPLRTNDRSMLTNLQATLYEPKTRIEIKSPTSNQSALSKPQFNYQSRLSSISKLPEPNPTSRITNWQSSSNGPTSSRLTEIRPVTSNYRSALNKPQHNYGSGSTTSNLSKLPELKPSLKADARPFVLPTIPTTQGFQSTSAPSPLFNNELSTELKVNVKVTKQYYDDCSKIPTYETHSPKKRGRLLLINNIEFKGKRRDGADVDQRNIVALFKQIGFEVMQHKNKNKIDMKRIIENFATDRNLKNCDICITVIMSHGTTYGEQTMIETIDEQILETEWVVQQFDGIKCKSMSGKPKIFIFQCCRGENEHANVQTDATMFQKPRQVQDILISYSTIPGFVAYRDPKLGSWYIQGLCKVFMEHAHDTSIEDLLKIVDAELAKLNVGSQRQTSSYENRGFKRCYLHPIGN